MNRKGVSYDVGRVMFGNWRPDYAPSIVHREIEIIKNDLHCNAIRICGLDLDRLMFAAETALAQGLEVWLSPEIWNRRPERTLRYIVKAATAAEGLRTAWPERLIFSVGSELTLFMQGIVPGRTFAARLRNPALWETVRAGKHNEPLRDFLRRANDGVRQVFHGRVTYAALLWEEVDWSLFDFVGVDHYRATSIEDRYADMLQSLFAYGKPVVITEFGCCTYQGAQDAGGRAWSIVDVKSLALHKIPLLGRWIRPRLNGAYVRDEELQARELVDQLSVLDDVGVDGAFIMTFTSPTNPYSDDPRYDLDMASYSLVKSYADGKRGTAYPDMTWEPKEAFTAAADYYKADT